MDKELEELKAKWIIEEKEFNERDLGLYVKRLMPFCKITKNGEIVLTEIGENFSLIDKVMLALIARFIAHRLDGSISETVTADELSRFFRVDKMQVSARLKDVKDARLAVREKKGIYKANIGRIEKFLDEIEGRYCREDE